MTIALCPAPKLSASRYRLVGQLSKYADWTQTLELPADGNTVSISAHSIEITFREYPGDTSAALTVSTADSQISITDADTISISVTDDVMSGLNRDRYYVDITSSNAGAITHWAHGVVEVINSPVAF
jgi:hypothetical protein